MPRITRKDRVRVEQFLDAAARMSVEDWRVVLERRQRQRSRIRKADSDAQSILLNAFRATFSRPTPKREDALDDAINERMVQIANAVPEVPTLKDETATFRTLVHLALRQAVSILRIYEPAMTSANGPRVAKTLCEAFVGYAPVPLP